MKPDLQLSERQKIVIRENFKKNPDLRFLTQKAWNKKGVDGRSKEGKAVREFLIEEGFEYETSELPKGRSVDLTQKQKNFLLSDNIQKGIKPIDAARLVFKNGSVVPLSAEHRVVQDFLKEFRPEVFNTEDEETSEEWKPPNTLQRTIKRVNDWVGKDFDEARMAVRERKGCEALMKNLQSERLKSIVNNYNWSADRKLFESEFIRSTWDKPDLTADEVNLYITVCANYVRAKHAQRRLDNINRFIAESEDPEIHMRTTEQLKTTSEELNQIEKRIESLINKLNGDRAKRLAAKGSNNVSILALVEAWQDYEERQRMVQMAEMENKLAEEEAERLESMDQMKARILGVTKHEVL